ncbi:Bug family tripartite tricarboxylate transporter substrate binding protein [Terrarubrum flagellatum]|uniref:Bug family tripartite tricarboxylate transporter substrate binding protein n=1 Tax=Terrirubrum flagellatum TaxID=2895980 RepID=UPI0031456C0E
MARQTTLRRALAWAGAAMGLGLNFSPALAFPDRPIALIVPFAAGGAADSTGRIIAESMAKTLGKPVIVENVAGAGGAAGAVRVKNAAPDGYIIGLGHTGTHAAAVTVNPKLPHNPKRDFAYLGLVASTPNVVFFRKDFPAKDLKEFIAVARSEQSKLTMGHSGNGAASHITCLLFFGLIDVQPTYVPYRGFGQTINDIMGGKIDGSCDLVASVSGQVQGETVKAYAVAATERSEAIPNVPTAIEAGLPEFVAETWTGLFAPKGTPKEIFDILHNAVASALDDPGVKQKLANIGARVPRPDERGGAHMQKLVETEIDRWAAILNKAGFKPD